MTRNEILNLTADEFLAGMFEYVYLKDHGSAFCLMTSKHIHKKIRIEGRLHKIEFLTIAHPTEPNAKLYKIDSIGKEFIIHHDASDARDRIYKQALFDEAVEMICCNDKLSVIEALHDNDEYMSYQQISAKTGIDEKRIKSIIYNAYVKKDDCGFVIHGMGERNDRVVKLINIKINLNKPKQKSQPLPAPKIEISKTDKLLNGVFK